MGLDFSGHSIIKGNIRDSRCLYMKQNPPWRALLFTHCTIEFPVLKTVAHPQFPV